ncbi:hypothetical protein E1B28_012888 [Marasmius oreades]|uniref:Major facilitator superfamily (MFS) profile domain-containing protein n=1 Tax=Marasmius oreades TaxID=181124 RepID=A0A9P7RT67_9AGAR|nr:uncharacterized protein E1B28_012888 [Marasmius oreades]KAG7088943.1 hypothetical protein E1B28_012888 [Marasmius oreades]
MLHHFDKVVMMVGLQNGQQDIDGDDAVCDAIDLEDEEQPNSNFAIIQPMATPLPVMSMTVLSIVGFFMHSRLILLRANDTFGGFKVMLSEFLSANVSSPFIFFMVKEFGVDEVPFWTGILVSTFFLSQFAASLLWTTIASYTSPRLVLILTLSGSALSTVVFGCSSTLPVAMVARLAQGMFAGGIGVAKAAVVGITDESNEPTVWGILGFCWGMGGVAAAVIGGIFERPATKWKVFDRVFFRGLPYFLPCAIASAVMLTGGALACFLAPDIRPRARRVSFDTGKLTTAVATSLVLVQHSTSRISSIRSVVPRSLVKKISLSQVFSEGDSCMPLLSSSLPGGYSSIATNDLGSRAGSRSRWFDSLGRRSVNPLAIPNDHESEGVSGRGRALHRVLREQGSLSRNRDITPRPVDRTDTNRFFPRSDTFDSAISIPVSLSIVDRIFPLDATSVSGPFIPEPPVPHPLPLAPIPEAISSLPGMLAEKPEGGQVQWKDELPIGLITQYGLLALHTTTHDQVFLAYFTRKYEEGGVGFGAEEFAGLIALMCGFQLVYQFYLYSKIGPPNGPFTHLTIFRASWVLYIISYLSVATYRGVFSGGSLMVALVGSTAIRYCGNTFAFTSIAILINTMTPPSSVGYANGVAQSVVSLARCFGPVLGGLLWSVSTDLNPSMYWISFVGCVGVCAAAVVHGMVIEMK